MQIYSAKILKQVEPLLNIGIALSAEKDHNRLLEMIVTVARRITGADAGTLYLREKDHLVFKIIQNETLQVFQGSHNETIELPPVPLRKENVSAYVALTRSTVNIADVYQTKDFDFSGPKRYDQLTGYRTTSLLVVPLENHEGDIIGVLQLINARDQTGKVVAFAPCLEKVVNSLGSQAAISLTNMQLLADIENLFRSFVEVMATAIDARTPYNANHTRRVAEMTRAMIQAINETTDGKLANETFDLIRGKQLVMAAWLHDIGKIATPLEVMNKATRLAGRLELVLARLDYISACCKIAYLEQKLALAGRESGEGIIELERSWEKDQQMVAQTREIILRANDPTTFVGPELVRELQIIAFRTYIDCNGNPQSWLAPEELAALLVPRGTLTPAERRIMEEHVTVTSRLLAKVPFARHFQNVPYWATLHHEQLDGKGYPRGMAGEEIPLEARILALLDIFDALTAADRPYKKAMPVSKALETLGIMVSEGKIDPELWRIFIGNELWTSVQP
ncbi:MAG: GAF domain-containing protein [Heliobacteriaceae bacterium]|nr:GAF domain-containing protein [Heliobacteriaceae bacterium]MDD4586808.1 GAF domain-containing protein [Heliobacteriaceae bacterium]